MRLPGVCRRVSEPMCLAALAALLGAPALAGRSPAGGTSAAGTPAGRAVTAGAPAGEMVAGHARGPRAPGREVLAAGAVPAASAASRAPVERRRAEHPAAGQTPEPRRAGLASLHERIDRRAAELEAKLVAWRRDFHQNPELSNREVRTAQKVAEHLKALGLEVRTGVARTGVVGVLRGGRPGPVVALRADMDALPVTEEVDVPFRSTVRAEYNGQTVGVMHACGHDLHMAILMGAAEVLAGLRAELPGTVVFLFQPAEEGPPPGEKGGAPLMIEEGALDDPKVEAVFGLHVFPFEVGSIHVRPGGIMAASDTWRLTVRGRQTHGAMPWAGVDPIVVASQIVLGMQTIVSRQIDLTQAPAVVTAGMIRGGVRFNIVPEEVVVEGTVRTFDPAMQNEIHERMRRTAAGIAASAGATAELTIDRNNPVTFNDPELTARMADSLRRVAAAFEPNARVTTTAEDFAYYQKKVPGMFFFLGITPRGADPATVHPNHSPRFYADEGALVPGVRAMASLAVDYLAGGAARGSSPR
jgi:amidohydrolase